MIRFTNSIVFQIHSGNVVISCLSSHPRHPNEATVLYPLSFWINMTVRSSWLPFLHTACSSETLQKANKTCLILLELSCTRHTQTGVLFFSFTLPKLDYSFMTSIPSSGFLKWLDASFMSCCSAGGHCAESLEKSFYTDTETAKSDFFFFIMQQNQPGWLQIYDTYNEAPTSTSILYSILQI